MTITITGTKLRFPEGSEQAVAANGQILIAQHVTATNGGDAIAGINSRPFSNTPVNTIAGSAVGANTITLPAGKYKVSGWAKSYRVNNTTTYLYSVTDSVLLLSGSGAYSDNSNGSADTVSTFSGIITLAATTDVRVQTYCQAAWAGNGLGVGFNNGVSQNVHAQVTIERIG